MELEVELGLELGRYGYGGYGGIHYIAMGIGRAPLPLPLPVPVPVPVAIPVAVAAAVILKAVATKISFSHFAKPKQIQ